MAEIPVGELHTADRDAFFRDTENELVYRRVRDDMVVQKLNELMELLTLLLGQEQLTDQNQQLLTNQNGQQLTGAP